MSIRTPIVLTASIATCLTLQLACSYIKRSEATAEPTPHQTDLVQQIIDSYEKALGGKEAIDAVTTLTTRGTFTTSVIREAGAFETWSKEPNKSLMTIDFPYIGKLKKGVDGDVRWVQTPLGTTSQQTPIAMAEVERDSDIYRAGKLAKLYESIRFDMKARNNGHDVYILEGKPAKGPSEKLFFNVQSGLLERWDMARKQAGRGTVFVKVHLDDYRAVDGLKVPFSIRFAFESFDLSMKLDEVKHNVAIDDAMFRKPG
jgi:hypothetical protein